MCSIGKKKKKAINQQKPHKKMCGYLSSVNNISKCLCINMLIEFLTIAHFLNDLILFDHKTTNNKDMKYEAEAPVQHLTSNNNNKQNKLLAEEHLKKC